jgi:hypothetical protein
VIETHLVALEILKQRRLGDIQYELQYLHEATTDNEIMNILLLICDNDSDASKTKLFTYLVLGTYFMKIQIYHYVKQ